MGQKENGKKKYNQKNIIQKTIQNISVRLDIQSMFMLVLSAMTIATTIVMGLLIYNRFKMSVKETAISNAESRIESTTDQVNGELRNMRQICNAINYNIVQEYDISDQEFSRQFSLLYEVNNDKIQSMALYDSNGKIIAAEPVAAQKKNRKVTEQDWYKSATDEIENIHISTPHIQDLFENETYQYNWVVSLSSLVDMNQGDTPDNGVLLVDMKYSMIEELLDNLNEAAGETYYYLCTDDGEILYHPRKAEIDRGLFVEESSKAAGYENGTYELSLNGKKGNVVVNNLSYTGWKLVGVVPEGVQTASINKFRYYIIATTIILLMMLLIVNKMIARKISKPILKLDESVKSYETGGKAEIYIGGSSEIRHLANSVQNSYKQIEQLMEEIIRQQNKRRKSELDALQSQINPHFLYNTLESITWMVEANKNEEAVFMISELAKLLRISLSKGKTVIRISDELQHSKSYMNIQLIRYKDRFKVEFLIDEKVENCCIVKLVVQPVLENAIYYGVGNMDEDEGGKITVRGERKDDDIFLSIEDNGMGMSQEVVDNLLTNSEKVPKHGSGVGLINVHTRIQLMFGEEYGLKIYSEPDEGTKVVIHIPAIPYSEEKREELENKNRKRERVEDEKK
ncbi:cache domain-containing sensor histidine kinase [Thermoguttaceae bacterium LCP21S3_D4]